MPEQHAAVPAVQPDIEADPEATASAKVSESATQPEPSTASPSSTAALGFSATETAGLVGITYRQLDHWAREGLVVPTMAKAHGSGSRRRYTYSDLLELKIVKKMRDAGIDLKSISRSFDYLRNQLGADVASSNIVISGTDALLVDEDAVLSLLRGGQGTMLNVLPVAGVKRELDADVVKLFPDEPIAVQLSFEIDADE